jgi:glycosyltransferase involved in cell wall biosynthesis
MDTLSVVILTKNEEGRIRGCLENVKWADEIIIVDDCSADRTVEICREYTDKIFRRKMDGFSQQRDFGAGKASGTWILRLDADEVVTPALLEEILGVLKSGTDCDAFTVYRANFYLGKRIRYCGWCLRIIMLLRKGKCNYDGRMVHEEVVVHGKIGHLNNEIWHYSYEKLSDHFAKMDMYTSYDTEELWRKGVRLHVFNYPFYFFIKPILIFFRKYIAMQGFREGVRGVFISAVTAFIVFMNYAKLWEKQKNDNGDHPFPAIRPWQKRRARRTGKG